MTVVENRTITVTGGIDTHLDFHLAAAIDSDGGELGVETFDTTTAGYRHLVAWLAGLGTISLIDVEGTGSYGAGLTRQLTGNGIRVVEVDRGGNRQANSALHRIMLTRMASDPRTQTYVARRTADGKTMGEIGRILKHYIAREIYPHLA